MTMIAISTGQLAEVEHLEDVIVADAARGLCLALEALRDLDVAGVGAVQNLDRDFALDADVFAQVDRTHSAFPDQLDDAVLTFDELSDFERHA